MDIRFLFPLAMLAATAGLTLPEATAAPAAKESAAQPLESIKKGPVTIELTDIAVSPEANYAKTKEDQHYYTIRATVTIRNTSKKKVKVEWDTGTFTDGPVEFTICEAPAGQPIDKEPAPPAARTSTTGATLFNKKSVDLRHRSMIYHITDPDASHILTIKGKIKVNGGWSYYDFARDIVPSEHIKPLPALRGRKEKVLPL